MTIDIQFIPCRTFGGGWLIPLTAAGHEAGESIFDDDPGPLPWGGELGYIVEPQDVTDTVLALRELGVSIELD